MANNQFSRKTVGRDREFSIDDPLAELARVVGYEPKRAGSPGDEAGPEARIDLEAELLRELQGFDEPAEENFEPAPSAAMAKGPDQSLGLDDVPLDEAGLSDELMTISLEDELLREFEVEQAAAPKEPDAVKAEGTEHFDFDLTEGDDLTGAFRTGPRDAAVEPIADTREESPEPEAPLSADPAEQAAASDDEEEGFAFPSMDELEDDPEFDSAAWSRPATGLDIRPDSLRLRPAEEESLVSPLSDRSEYEIEPSTESEPESTGHGDPAEEAEDIAPPAEAASQPREKAADQPSAEIRAGDDASDGLAWEQGEPEAIDWPEGWNASEPEQQDTLRDEQPLPASSDDVLAEMDRFDLGSTDGDDRSAGDAGADRMQDGGAPVESEGSALEDWLRTATAEAEGKAYDRISSETDSNVIALRRMLEPQSPNDGATDEPGGEGPAEASRPQPGAAAEEPIDLSEHMPLSEVDGPAAPLEAESVAAMAEAERGDGAGSHLDEEPSSPEDGEAAAGDQALPFDEAAITEHDQAVEPMAALDIPRLPEEEKPQAAPGSDFDFDVDADFLGLLSENAPAAAEASVEKAESTDARPAALAALTPALPLGIDTAGRATGHFEDPTHESFDFDDLEQALDESLDEARRETSSAPHPTEEVILPAAAAVAPAVERRRGGGGKRLLVTAAGIVVIAAVGALMWSAGGPDQAAGGGPRIIAANDTPVKQKPKNPGGKTVPNQNKIVYDHVDGTENAAPQQKELLASAEKPMDVVQRTLQPDLPSDASATGAKAAAPVKSVEPAKDQARLTPDTKVASASPSSAMPSGVQPHFVRTMTVTADGKLAPLVQNGGGAAAASAAPAAQANAPAKASPPPKRETPTAMAPQPSMPASSGEKASAPQPAAAQPSPNTPSSAPAAGNASSAVAAMPVPAPRPQHAAPQVASAEPLPADAGRQPANPAPAAKAATRPAVKTETASAEPANPGGFFIQIGSQPTEAGAKATYQNLLKRYQSVLGGHGVDIQRADLGSKGVYYRVRVPAGSYTEASDLCQKYKGAGGSCYVTR